MTKQNKSIALLIFLYLVLAWGSSFILVKKALLYLPAFSIGFFRIFLVSLWVLPFSVIFIKKYSIKFFMYASLVGFVGNLIPFVLYAFAQRGVDSYVAGVLNGTTTFFTLILGIFFWKQKSSLIQWIGVILGFAGVVGLLVFAGERNFSWNFFHGSLILLATFMYGLNVHIVKHYLKNVSSLAIVSLAFVLPGLVSFGVLWYSDILSLLGDPKALYGLFYLLILAILCTVIALMLYYYLIKITSPVFSVSVTYVMPIVSLLWGALDGEKITFLHILMMGIILIGVFLSNLDVFNLKGKLFRFTKKSTPNYECSEV